VISLNKSGSFVGKEEKKVPTKETRKMELLGRYKVSTGIVFVA